MHIKKKSKRRHSKSYNKKSTRNIRRHLHKKTYKGGMFGFNENDKNDELESCKLNLDSCKRDLETLADSHEDETTILQIVIERLKHLHRSEHQALEDVYKAYDDLCKKYDEENLYKDMTYIKSPVTNYDKYYPKDYPERKRKMRTVYLQHH